MRGRAAIGTSAIIVAGTLSLAEVQKNERLPSTRQWIALAAAYLLMSMAADLGAEGLGAGLAFLLMISTVLVRGEDVLALLGVRIGAVKQRPLSARDRRRVRPTILGPIRQVQGGTR